eukprot:CCRYP_002675-RA/>CCRYP_002675-RA protein AED:0.32 eAED:0.32 QI:143/1/1/1/0.75/0.6/5/24/472
MRHPTTVEKKKPYQSNFLCKNTNDELRSITGKIAIVMTDLTLDLHGRRLEDAIAAVTLYFDRIRSTYAAIHPTSAATSNSLKVTVITGSGSHSTHGPVLRSAVQKLLVKRGMTFSIEPGKGAFTVDALSGWDLYASEVPTDTKVQLSEQHNFHLLASSKKSTARGASFHQALTGNSASIAKASRDNKYETSSETSADPLPKQVALENDAIRCATELSIAEAQKRRTELKKLQEQQKIELKRAMSESQAEYAVYGRCLANEEMEIQKALALSSRAIHEDNVDDAEKDDLKFATEQSLLAEQERRQKEEEMFEEEIKRALARSAQLEKIRHTDDQCQENLDLLNTIQISLNENKAGDMSDEDALQTALQLSQNASDAGCEEALLNQIIQISLKENLKEEYYEPEVQKQRTVVTDAAWFYIDPQGNVQGPFDGDIMRQWLAAGYFNGDLNISQSKSGPFFSIITIVNHMSLAFYI